MNFPISITRLVIHNSQVWSAWVALLFLMSWLDKTSLTVPWVGDLAVIFMGITLGGFVFLRVLTYRKLPLTVCLITGLIGLLIFIYAASQAFNPIKSSRIVLQLFLVTFCFIGSALLLSRDRAILILANLWVGMTFVHLLLWVRAGFVYPFQGLFLHKNLLGGLTLFGLFFVWAARSLARSKSWWNWGGAASLIVLLASGSRASWLAAMVAMAVYLFWRQMAADRRLFSLVFLFMLIAILGFVFIYINLSLWETFSQMQIFVMQYTGQRLNSGRDVIWPLLINAIQEHPWGYGPGATLERLGFESTLSAHNLFIQVTLQTGVMGLASLFVILWSIWMSLYKKRGDNIVRLSGAFLMAALVHESFEVSLIQNNLTIGIVIWTILGIGVGRLYLAHPSLSSREILWRDKSLVELTPPVQE